MKRTRSIVFVHVCVVFAALAIGLVLMWPWLLGTTVRFKPAQLAVIWLAEALALIAFLGWAMKALVIEEDASQEREDLKRPDRLSWLELFLVLGLAIDIAASYYHDYELSHARRGAVLREGKFVDAQIFRKDRDFCALVECRVPDAQGNWHRTWIYGSSLHFSDEALDQLKRKAFPIPFQVYVDDGHPHRIWPQALKWGHSWDPVHLQISISMWAFMASLIGLLLATSRFTAFFPPRYAWPLIGIAAYCLCTGLKMWLHGETSWPF